MILSTMILAAFQVSTAQVSSVDYSLKFNTATCLYDVYMVVEEGNARGTLQRAQFNAQVSIVAPTTSSVYVTESYMPIVDNQNRSGNEPATWSISNELEDPETLEGSRIVSVIPQLLPTAFYNDLAEGDEVKIFSVKVNPVPTCAQDVRLYDNEMDPSSFYSGMSGADFRNGFTIGGVEQKYNKNTEVVLPTGPNIEYVNFSATDKIALDVNIVAKENAPCQETVSLSIETPAGATMDYRSFLASDVADLQMGDYQVVAKDELGCVSKASFTPISTEVETVPVTAFESGVYPNPAQNQFALTLEGPIGTKIHAQMLDVEGKVAQANILDITLDEELKIVNIDTNVVPGMYNLSLTINEGHKVTHKILIIK